MRLLFRQRPLRTRILKHKLAIFVAVFLVIISSVGILLKSKPQPASAAGADDFVTTWRVAGNATGRTVVFRLLKIQM